MAVFNLQIRGYIRSIPFQGSGIKGAKTLEYYQSIVPAETAAKSLDALLRDGYALMKSKLINAGREKTWAVIFEAGDEVIAGLTAFAREKGLSASHFTAIGALSDALLGHFNLEKKDYKRIPITEQVEVLSLMGDIVLQKNESKVHAHIVLGKSDGTAWGGHLLRATVRPTLEVILTETPGHLQRKTHEDIGLALIDLESETGSAVQASNHPANQ